MGHIGYWQRPVEPMTNLFDESMYVVKAESVLLPHQRQLSDIHRVTHESRSLLYSRNDSAK